jgi:CBS domain-containing protein
MAEQGTVGSMPVTAFLGDNVKTIPPESSVLDVVAALADADVGLLALGEGRQVTGVVSERDVVRSLAKGMDPATTNALDIASTKLVWCDASASVADVATEMLEHYVRHVLVEEDGHLVGMVSARDLLGAYASADAEEGDEE